MSNTDDPLRELYPFPHGDGQDAGTVNGGSSCDAADWGSAEGDVK
jgi:hypothetical protein